MPRTTTLALAAAPRDPYVSLFIESMAAGLARLVDASPPIGTESPESGATCLEFSAESRLSGPTREPAENGEAGDVEP
jgi:hypothetical protein